MTAAALAVKVALVAPAGTSTETGTVRAEVRLLASATLEPLPEAALERTTVQVVEAEAGRLVLVHCREEIVIGAMTENARDLVDPLKEAVRGAL